MSSITQSIVKELFDYHPDGFLIWKVARGRARIGDKAGSLKKTGYLQTRVDGHFITIHRLVFMWHHGYLPAYIDHIDRDKLNNKIENLRAVTASQNSYNIGKPKGARSQYKGVCWCTAHNSWIARIQVEKKRIHLKAHPTEIDAARAYDAAVILHNLQDYIPLNFPENAIH